MRQILFFCCSFFVCLISAQTQTRKSTLEEQAGHYSSFKFQNEYSFDSLRSAEGQISVSGIPTAASSSTCTLNKRVFGWHPYWNGTSYNAYQWNLLSDLCYFDYSVSPSTGSNTNASFAWNTASVVTVAKNNGVKVHICATMFSGHSTFWNSATAQNTFITNIISLLNAKQGNGVNIDFEGMGASDKTPFISFITNLNTALNTANPNYELSVCLYAVDWSSVFDMPALGSQVDFFTIMGYDYYYSGSAQAGPTAPVYNFQTNFNYTLSKSITYYLKQGAPGNKLLLGLPYYGREWEVTGVNVPAATTGSFSASRTLSYINNNPVTYSNANKYWDGYSFTPYYKYVSGASSNRQCFVDDVYSLGRKYDMVNQRGLAGIGIWALGYDAGTTMYWDLIRDKFSDCAPLVCTDSIYDMGGPLRNYYDSEKYFYTLSAPAGSLTQLQFYSFNTELNYDTLWIYNGTNTLSPLMGSFTGTNSPGIVTSTGQALTLRFKSDGATVTSGFKAYRVCTPDLATSMPEQSESGLQVFPNPSSGIIEIKGDGISSMALFDIQGKEIMSQPFPADGRTDLSSWHLTNGLYILKIMRTDNSVTYLKLIYSN